MYLLGYIPRDNRIYLIDKSFNIVSYSLHLTIINYQTAILRNDIITANKILPSIPNEHRNRIAHFLDAQGLKEQALLVSIDNDHKFDLSIQLGKLEIAVEIAKESATEQKWKQLSDLAILHSKLDLAEKCLLSAQDFSGLLLLYTSTSNSIGIQNLATLSLSKGKHNIAFICLFLLNKLEDCLDLLIETNRIPEAAFLARTYVPSQVSRIVKIWKQDLQLINQRAADSLSDPLEYNNLFPDFNFALKAEKYFKQQNQNISASRYLEFKDNISRDLIQEIKLINLEDEQESSSSQKQEDNIDNSDINISHEKKSDIIPDLKKPEEPKNVEDDFDELSRALEEPLDE
jgi:coatomer subunit beta'